MKFKITSFHLVCVVLVQIVVIDIIVISFLMGFLNQKTQARASTHIAIENGKHAVHPAEKMKAPAFDVLMEAYRKISFGMRDGRSFKIIDDSTKTTYEDQQFIATTYDLSYESCGKYPGHPAYGITFSGKRAVKGRTIAVDPDVIPLGSQVFIEFPKPYTHLDGWYVAEDTGSKVKGNIIDVFLGESAFYEMEKFGSRKVNIKVVLPVNEHN